MSNDTNSRAFQAPSHVQSMAPYQPGKPIDELAREFGIQPHEIIKLASNENPLGIPKSAQDAMVNVIEGLGRYPDPTGYELKSELASHYGVPSSWITLGNGSNDLLELVSLALLTRGDAVVYSKHAFAVYHLATQARGARHIVVPAVDYGHDLDAMLGAIDIETRIVFIANPNNPTGTFLSANQISKFLEQVQQQHGERVVVVLDEAYNEYLEPEHRFDSSSWVEQYPNLIVTRTFSKAYGLAGLRIGFAIAQPRITDLLNRVRQPFNVNTLAQAAAIAALNDQKFLEESYQLNKVGKKYLQDNFTKLGLKFVPSYGNFVLVEIGENTAQIHLELLKKGIIVRPVGGDGLPNHLRVSVGLQEENEKFISALTEILSK